MNLLLLLATFLLLLRSCWFSVDSGTGKEWGLVQIVLVLNNFTFYGYKSVVQPKTTTASFIPGKVSFVKTYLSWKFWALLVNMKTLLVRGQQTNSTPFIGLHFVCLCIFFHLTWVTNWNWKGIILYNKDSVTWVSI